MKMGRVTSLLPVLILITWILFGQLSASDNATDRLALLSFKSLISKDPSGWLTSWGNTSLHFCEWPGIGCSDPRHPERVTELELDSLGLVGSISPYLGNLTFLTRINLSINFLEGSIPQDLSRCTHLQSITMWGNNLGGVFPTNLSRCCPDLVSIDLSNNTLVGSIPSELGSISKLEKLILFDNNLSGGVPPSLGNLTSLLLLDISENNLAGSIPPSLGRLSTLKRFDLSFSSLIGTIPSSFGALSALTFFSLQSNQLEGTIPPSLWNLSLLEYFAVSTNELHGTLPSNLGHNFPRLQTLGIAENFFSGPIPLSLPNASLLEFIDLSTNNFSGIIPPCLGALRSLTNFEAMKNRLQAKKADDWSFLHGLRNCSNLRLLALDRNLLEGTLPKNIGNLSTTLTWLTMSENQISGSIPAGIRNLVSLSKLDMSFNLLVGAIPATIGVLNGLSILDFSENKLSGRIPWELGNLTQLTGLYLGGAGGVTGTIPVSLGNCQSLVTLDLSRNKLNGTIPVELFKISTLARYFLLSGNSLTGSIPREIGSLKNVNFMNVSWNKLSGEIPDTLGECLELQFLYMEGNFINGSIPRSLSSLKGLVELDLSRNILSGQIPEFLAQFNLSYLNLSFNGFYGEVPKVGVFANSSAISVVGNEKLCGGDPRLNLPPCSDIESSVKKEDEFPVVAVIASSVGALFLLIIASLGATMYWIRKARNNRCSPVKYISSHVRVSYAELARATNGFTPTNLIGAGSFGSVYLGVMELDHTIKTVAVKVINLKEIRGSKSFMMECEALRNIRHRNLVKILTSCSSIDFEGNDFKALVFDYMPNGSLEDWLHPDPSSEPKTLSLVERLNVAIDVASALDYLHHHGQTPIVHCDLKPSNILLDVDMVAHVADFGLARFIVESTTDSTNSNPTSSMGLKGSFGYIPPEYGMGNKVSIDGDVYSYGILLLYMFTGKRPTDHIFQKGISLREFVDRAVVDDRAIEVADQSLFSKEKEEAVSDKRISATDHECLVLVLRIGLLCSKESPPTERMPMGKVVQELLTIRGVFFGDGNHLRKVTKC